MLQSAWHVVGARFPGRSAELSLSTKGGTVGRDFICGRERLWRMRLGCGRGDPHLLGAYCIQIRSLGRPGRHGRREPRFAPSKPTGAARGNPCGSVWGDFALQG